MIDKVTGLPEVPEGYRWFVAEDKSEYTRSKEYRVILQKWSPKHLHIVKRKKRTWRSLWFSLDTVFEKEIKDMWVKVEQDYLFDFNDEGIVKVAERVLIRFNRREYIKSRLGAYPPNSIPQEG